MGSKKPRSVLQQLLSPGLVRRFQSAARGPDQPSQAKPHAAKAQPAKPQTTTPRAAKLREPGREQPPAFYDQTFLENAQWRCHYTESGYYPIWTVLADRIRSDRIDSILEIGCGSGQMAQFLRDQGLRRYLGFDFSPERLNYAKSICPELAFVIADALTTDLLARHDYDGVLCTEFLEHVERDLDVLAKIRPGAHFYGTVPNFPSRAHVRHFANAEQVAERYASHFENFFVTVHLANNKGKTFFILDGVKR